MRTINFENGHSNRVNGLHILCILLAFFCGVASDVNACQGQDFQKSVNIINTSWLEGQRIGTEIAYGQIDFLSGMQQLISTAQYLREESQALPYSCQALIDMWANQIAGGSSGGGGANCMGGVCCDSTGCYGG